MNFSWRKALQLLRLNKWKRLTLLTLTFISAFLVIILGSTLYTSRNTRQAIAYGGGTEYLVKIQSNDPNADVTQIANEIYQRIDRIGVVGVQVSPESYDNDKFVRITYPGLNSPAEIAALEQEITAKPSLVFTDIWGNPLFTPSGNFDNYRLTNTTSGAQRELDSINWASDSQVPLVANGVTSIYQTSGYKLRVQFDPSQLSQWTAATNYLATLPEGSRKLVIWVNMGQFIDVLKSTPGKDSGTTLWDDAGKDPFKAAHINNDITAPLRIGDDYLVSDVQKYLVTSVDIAQAQNTQYYTIDSAFNVDESINWARQLNFAIANYGLTTTSTTTLSPPSGDNALMIGLIAIASLFALASFFLVINYGLLGVVATLGLALFVAVTVLLFTLMRGEYSPEAMGIFMLGFGLALDSCVTFFERIKGETSVSKNIVKASATARRNSWQLLDGNILFFIVGVCLFYFGSQNAVGVSVAIMLTSALTLVIATGLVRLVTYWLLGLTALSQRLYLFGSSASFDAKVQSRLSKVNYLKVSRGYGVLAGLVALAGMVMLIATSAIANNINGSFNLTNFTSQATYQFNVNQLSATNLAAAQTLLTNAGFKTSDFVYGSLNNVVNSVRVVTPNTTLIASLDPTALQGIWGTNYNFSVATPTLNTQMVYNALTALGVSAAIAFVYLCVRLRWTYALAIMASLIVEAAFLIALLVFSNLALSPQFVSIALAGLSYSLYDKVVILSRVKENIASHTSAHDDASIKRLANEALIAVSRRSMFLGLFMAIAFTLLLALSSPLNLDQGAALLVLSLNGTLSSLLLAPIVLVRLEIWRHQGIVRRERKNFWKTAKIEEQTIQGINDFRF